MKLTIKNLRDNPTIFMRNCGYALGRNNDSNEPDFVRRITGQDFPRYHAYVRLIVIASSAKQSNLEINLHIDQKKPSYGTSAAHSGDYDSDLVRQELGRIYDIASR